MKKEETQKPVLKKSKSPEGVKKKNKRDVVKIIIFNCINIFLIVLIIIIVRRLPDEAEKVKNLRSEQIAAQESLSVGVLQSEVEKNSTEISKMENAFVNEQRFIEFVTSIEQIRAQGVLQEFSFPVTDPVEDKEDNLGLPVSVALRGDINSINQTVEQILSLPFLIRTVNANLESVGGEENTYVLRLGLFLYVHEDFSQN